MLWMLPGGSCPHWSSSSRSTRSPRWRSQWSPQGCHGIPASPLCRWILGSETPHFWSFHGDFDAWVSATWCRVWKGILESQWLLWKTMDSLRGCTQCRWGTVADRVWNQRDCTKSKIRPGHSQSYDTGMVCSKAIQNISKCWSQKLLQSIMG